MTYRLHTWYDDSKSRLAINDHDLDQRLKGIYICSHPIAYIDNPGDVDQRSRSQNKVNKLKIENCFIFIPKGNS